MFCKLLFCFHFPKSILLDFFFFLSCFFSLMPCIILKTYNTSVPGVRSVCSLAVSIAKSLMAVRIHYLLKVHYCCKFSIACIAPVKIVITHRAHKIVLQNSQMSQMLLPSYNGRNDLWKQKRPTMGPNYFFGYI